jgi:hypothetical protein
MSRDQQRTFTFINNAELVSIIESARRFIIYAAPSISEPVAKSLSSFAEKYKDAALRIIVDADAEAFRLGFGEAEGLKLLTEKQLDIRRASGLRIAVLVADENAWVYSPTPEIIFEQPDSAISNAVKVNVEFAKQILFSIAPDISVAVKEDVLDKSIIIDESTDEDNSLPAESTKSILDESFLTDEVIPEIGTEAFTQQDMEKIETELKENPPQKFDTARRVRVYRGYIQFVELSFTGCRLTSKTITLPQSILNVTDETLREKVRTTCRILDGRNILSMRVKLLEDKTKKLRKDYIKCLGDRYGSVILRKKRAEFDVKVNEIQEELKQLKETIREELEAEIDKSLSGLVEMLLSGLLQNPPPTFRNSNNEVDKDLLKKFLSSEIKKQLPDPNKLVESMNFYCDYKDVTFEMLNDKDFVQAVNDNYPDENFVKLYSEEQTIAERAKKNAEQETL